MVVFHYHLVERMRHRHLIYADATAYKGDSALVNSWNWSPVGHGIGTAVAAAYVAAAQTNITSLGTLTALTVDSICLDGTTIGHTSDTDLMTVADGLY